MSDHVMLAKRIGLVGIANLILEINGLVLLPFLTKNLSISDYGIWVQITVTLGLIPAIALMGLPYAMVRFLASLRNKNEIAEVFYALCLPILAASLAVSVILFLLADSISLALFNGQAALVRILSLIVFLECLNQIPLAYFRAVQQIKRYAAFSTLRVILNIFLVVYFIREGYGLYGAAVGLLITVVAIFVCMALLIGLDVRLTRPKLESIKEYLAFGIPTVPGNLASWIVNSSDRYVLGMLIGTAAVGYYSPGYTLGNLINIFISPVSFMLPAALSRYYDSHNMDEVRTVLRRSAKYFLALAIPSAFGLSILSHSILVELSTQEIADRGYLITPFVAISAIFLGLYAVIGQVMVIEKRTEITGFVWIIAAAVNLGLNLVLIPVMGMLGAALTTLLAFALAFFATFHYTTSNLRDIFDWDFIVRSLTASIIMSVILMALDLHGTANIFIGVVLGAGAYFTILVAIHGINRDEIAFLMNILRL